MDLTELLAFVVKNKASDLHLSSGLPPMIRVHGDVRRINVPPMEHKEVHAMIYDIMNDGQRKFYEENLECDFSFAVPNLARFRVNAFVQQRGAAAVMRTIPSKILSLEDLKAPKSFVDIADQPRGIVLVTGPTGSGKSTTLAAMLDRINSSRPAHIMTIEDPIEYIHHHKKCIVNQREVGADTESFVHALKYVLRQDPDVILIGEMRDRETFGAALTIAETGHLVFATLHTNSTFEAINRIVDGFPSDQQKQIYTQLAFVLEGVVTQQLVPRQRGGGRAMVAEVLVCTPGVKAVIREGKTHQIYSLMQAGQKYGMQTMNQGLMLAVQDKAISPEEAMNRSSDPGELEQMLSKTNTRASI